MLSYEKLVNQISKRLQKGRMQAYQIVNHQLVITYWEIGRYIVEYEQGGK